MNTQEVQKLLNENIRRLNLHLRHFQRLIPTHPEQKRLTEKWIIPYQDLILEDILLLRKEVDKKLLRRESIQRILQQRTEKSKRYPYGFCLSIRDLMFEEIKSRLFDEKKSGLKFLREFALEGGVIQKFWGIDKGIYFQNAIQIGDAVLDVANDTVFVEKPSLDFYPSLEKSAIKSIDSFVEFAHVSKLYWHQESYPNFYLPELAPMFPIFIVKTIHTAAGKELSVVMLQTGISDLLYPNLFTEYKGNWFGLAQKFLFDSEYSDRRLPVTMAKKLPPPDVAATKAIFQGFRTDTLKSVPALIKVGQSLMLKGLSLENKVLGQE